MIWFAYGRGSGWILEMNGFPSAYPIIIFGTGENAAETLSVQ